MFPSFQATPAPSRSTLKICKYCCQSSTLKRVIVLQDSLFISYSSARPFFPAAREYIAKELPPCSQIDTICSGLNFRWGRILQQRYFQYQNELFFTFHVKMGWIFFRGALGGLMGVVILI